MRYVLNDSIDDKYLSFIPPGLIPTKEDLAKLRIMAAEDEATGETCGFALFRVPICSEEAVTLLFFYAEEQLDNAGEVAAEMLHKAIQKFKEKGYLYIRAKLVGNISYLKIASYILMHNGFTPLTLGGTLSVFNLDDMRASFFYSRKEAFAKMTECIKPIQEFDENAKTILHDKCVTFLPDSLDRFYIVNGEIKAGILANYVDDKCVFVRDVFYEDNCKIQMAYSALIISLMDEVSEEKGAGVEFVFQTMYPAIIRGLSAIFGEMTKLFMVQEYFMESASDKKYSKIPVFSKKTYLDSLEEQPYEEPFISCMRDDSFWLLSAAAEKRGRFVIKKQNISPREAEACKKDIARWREVCGEENVNDFVEVFFFADKSETAAYFIPFIYKPKLKAGELICLGIRRGLEEIIGTVVFERVPGSVHELNLEFIRIDEKYRNEGYGGRLLSEACEMLRGQGFDTITAPDYYGIYEYRFLNKLIERNGFKKILQ